MLIQLVHLPPTKLNQFVHSGTKDYFIETTITVRKYSNDKFKFTGQLPHAQQSQSTHKCYQKKTEFVQFHKETNTVDAELSI